MKRYSAFGGLYIGSRTGDDIQHWGGTARLPVGFGGGQGVRRDLFTRLAAQGVPFRYRDPVGLEVMEQFQGWARLGPYWTWLGFLWVGKQPKALRPCCGAKTRKGGACQARAAEGKERCRLHGGLSTGAKTAEGRARICESNRRRAEARRAEAKRNEARRATPAASIAGGVAEGD